MIGYQPAGLMMKTECFDVRIHLFTKNREWVEVTRSHRESQDLADWATPKMDREGLENLSFQNSLIILF